MKNLWLWLRCQWHEVCFEHGDTKAHIGASFLKLCEKCETRAKHDITLKTNALRRELMNR